MEFKTIAKIHNRFDIVVRNAETGEIEQKAQAENIVLDRVYSRLTTFNTYFVNIVFGSGTGTPTSDRTTLFTRVGYKAATTSQLVRAFPTSTWTRTIRLDVSEYNGNTLREVGISDDTTSINTHALITDSEGNPLEVEKNNLRIIDIYATVYATLYNVDEGLYFNSTGLRDYLTGGTVGSDSLTIGFVSDDDASTLNSTRTTNSTEKSVTTTVQFGVTAFNKEVRYIQWNSIGLRCILPRPGVFDGYPKTGVVLGTGDGVKTTFTVSNKAIKDLVVYVDGVISSDYTINTIQQIVFNTPIASGSTVTADYICIYIPKDSDHVLNVSMKIQFGGGQPTPVITPTPINAPGNQSVIAGSSTYGFFGEVVTTDLINGADLCSLIGLTAGTLQYSTEPWLKFVLDSRILYVAKKTIRYNVSWDNINATGAVWGDKIILLNGIKYAVRLLSSAEWNKLMYPIHVSYNTWASYSDSEIAVNYQVTPYGSATWTSTPSGSGRVSRGNNSLSYSNSYAPSSVYADFGFRPVLEIL